ncbi:MAG: hypothetical protein ACM3XM_21230 [Mycobacterium leprae]
MGEEARCYQAIAHCRLAMNADAEAIAAGETGRALAESAGEWDLLGEILVDLAQAHGHLHHYVRQAEALARYLTLRDRLHGARMHEQEVQLQLGDLFVRKGDWAEAAAHLTAGLALANGNKSDERLAHYRGQLLLAYAKSGELSQVPGLLRAAERFVQQNPQHEIAAFWYWYTRAENQLASGDPAGAGEALQKAWPYARGNAKREVAYHMLSARQQMAEGAPHNALQAAREARVIALDAQRYDLEYEIVDEIVKLRECMEKE